MALYRVWHCEHQFAICVVKIDGVRPACVTFQKLSDVYTFVATSLTAWMFGAGASVGTAGQFGAVVDALVEAVDG